MSEPLSQRPIPQRPEGTRPGTDPLILASALGSPNFKRGLPASVWATAGLVVLALAAGLMIAGRGRTRPSASETLSLDSYAENLPITGEVMSESVSLSGGKSTFIDGLIRNVGQKTVTAVTVQVFFRNQEGMPPHVETLPLSIVRTREPYVDTQPISVSPLRPGDDREFRLIFENLPGNWDVRLPEIHIIRATTK